MKNQSEKARVTEALLQLEQRRCAAIGRADALALEKTLAEDYVHVHATGEIDNRSGFIAGVLLNPRLVERSNIAVRIYGDVAILIGEQINRRNGATARGTMQQVAAMRDGVWRFIAAQVTLKS